MQTRLPAGSNLPPVSFNYYLIDFQLHPILQGGSVPPASNSRMPPLPHEPAGFYNDRGATVDIPLDSTKVHRLPLFLLLLWDSVFFTESVLPKKNKIITMLFHSNALTYASVVRVFPFGLIYPKVMYNIID